MKNLNTQRLVVAMSIILMVTACGKNMSMRVAGVANNSSNKAGTIDASKVASTKVSLTSDQELQDFSEFDKQDKTAVISEGALTKRATLQIAPKDAVTQVVKMELILDHAVLADHASICTSEALAVCVDLAKFVKDPASSTLQLDLREVFDLSKKTDAELMDWIYANTTEFAAPGYRKLRLNFSGVTSIARGEVIISVIANEKLPKDFATAPTAFTNGPSDQISIVAPATEATNTDTDTSTVTNTSTDTTTATDTNTSTATTP